MSQRVNSLNFNDHTNSYRVICKHYIHVKLQLHMSVYYSILQCIDDGTLPIWQTKPAPTLAVNYWRLKVRFFTCLIC